MEKLVCWISCDIVKWVNHAVTYWFNIGKIELTCRLGTNFNWWCDSYLLKKIYSRKETDMKNMYLVKINQKVSGTCLNFFKCVLKNFQSIWKAQNVVLMFKKMECLECETALKFEKCTKTPFSFSKDASWIWRQNLRKLFFIGEKSKYWWVPKFASKSWKIQKTRIKKWVEFAEILLIH